MPLGQSTRASASSSLELIEEIHLDEAATTFLSSHLAPNLAADDAQISHILRSALGRANAAARMTHGQMRQAYLADVKIAVGVLRVDMPLSNTEPAPVLSETCARYCPDARTRRDATNTV
jgi:hypothetical protein